MIKIKKIIFFIIKSTLAIVALLTLVLFFYTAFFYDPSSIEKETAEDQIFDQKSTKIVPKVTQGASKIEPKLIKMRPGTTFGRSGHRVEFETRLFGDKGVLVPWKLFCFGAQKDPPGGP